MYSHVGVTHVGNHRGFSPNRFSCAGSTSVLALLLGGALIYISLPLVFHTLGLNIIIPKLAGTAWNDIKLCGLHC